MYLLDLKSKTMKYIVGANPKYCWDIDYKISHDDEGTEALYLYFKALSNDSWNKWLKVSDQPGLTQIILDLEAEEALLNVT